MNYDFPRSIAAYVQRVGRTGHQGQKGWGYSFLTEFHAPSAGLIVNFLDTTGQRVDLAVRRFAELFQATHANSNANANANANANGIGNGNGGGDDKSPAKRLKTAASGEKDTVCCGNRCVQNRVAELQKCRFANCTMRNVKHTNTKFKHSKCKIQNAKCKMQNAQCKMHNASAISPSNAIPDRKCSNRVHAWPDQSTKQSIARHLSTVFTKKASATTNFLLCTYYVR